MHEEKPCTDTSAAAADMERKQRETARKVSAKVRRMLGSLRTDENSSTTKDGRMKILESAFDEVINSDPLYGETLRKIKEALRSELEPRECDGCLAARAEMQAKCEEWERDMESMRAKCERIRSKNRTLERDLGAQVEYSKKLVGDLMREINGCGAERREKDQALAELKEQVAKLTDEAESLRKENATLKRGEISKHVEVGRRKVRIPRLNLTVLPGSSEEAPASETSSLIKSSIEGFDEEENVGAA